MKQRFQKNLHSPLTYCVIIHHVQKVKAVTSGSKYFHHTFYRIHLQNYFVPGGLLLLRRLFSAGPVANTGFPGGSAVNNPPAMQETQI